MTYQIKGKYHRFLHQGKLAVLVEDRITQISRLIVQINVMPSDNE